MLDYLINLYLTNDFESALRLARNIRTDFGQNAKLPEFVKVIAEWEGDYNVGYFTTINPLIAEYLKGEK